MTGGSGSSSRHCVTYTTVSVVVAFALYTLLYAITEKSFPVTLRDLVSAQQISNSTAIPHLCNCTSAAAPPPAVVQIVEKVKTVVQECPKQEDPAPWYVHGRAWHEPVRFPRCTMDACFDFSRCDNMSELLVYVYEFPPAKQYLEKFNKSRYFTADPHKACLFFVIMETNDPYHDPAPPQLASRPYWNGGLNHVLLSFADFWSLTHVDPAHVGNASVLAASLYQSIYRPGFDIAVTVPPHFRFHEFRSLKPTERRYFLTFKGLRYLGPQRNYPGMLRSEDSFREIHNGDDIIVVLSCRHPVNDDWRRKNETLGANCDHDEAIFDQFNNYGALMNSTFGLAPAGMQPSSYRFTEILSAGAIPVLIADNYVKPFNTLVQWHRCIVQFPTSEMRRIVPTLRKMSTDEMLQRQQYCLKIYSNYLSSDEALLRGTMDSLKARFMGAVPDLMPAPLQE